MGSWGAYGACSEERGRWVRTRTFSVSVGSAFGGAACVESSGATDSIECKAQPCPVPVDCCGEWGQWSECSVECGGGVRLRSYQVVTPAADGGSTATCAASDGASESGTCNTDPCPVDCEGTWSSWGACSVPCGSGMQSRAFTVTQVAAYGGASCPSTTTQTQACNTEACPPVDCVGSWSGWTSCSGRVCRRLTVSVILGGDGRRTRWSAVCG